MKKIALEEHFWTEGFPHTGKVGAERVMFSVDYPLEDSLEAAPISEPERELICWKNAAQLLRL